MFNGKHRQGTRPQGILNARCVEDPLPAASILPALASMGAPRQGVRMSRCKVEGNSQRAFAKRAPV